MSRLICNRLEAALDAQPSPDQAGFRRGYSTEDHLFTTAVLYEQSYRWQRPLWAAVIDFKKALDCVSHGKLWEALRQQHISAAYMNFLQQMYSDQTAT
eukprot:5486763-Pyramimonas_sp.AAC.1